MTATGTADSPNRNTRILGVGLICLASRLLALPAADCTKYLAVKDVQAGKCCIGYQHLSWTTVLSRDALIRVRHGRACRDWQPPAPVYTRALNVTNTRDAELPGAMLSLLGPASMELFLTRAVGKQVLMEARQKKKEKKGLK